MNCGVLRLDDAGSGSNRQPKKPKASLTTGRLRIRKRRILPVKNNMELLHSLNASMDYEGGHMEGEKTLLQQIRDKEQEFSKKIEMVKQETDAQIATARAGREKALIEAQQTGKNTADELFRKEQQNTDSEIERMKKASAAETEAARVKGERNLPLTTDKIVSYVIME
jgi:vacuolar-type H+-ATPase subunit H